MNTVELFAKYGVGIARVLKDLRNSGVKYYPVTRVDGGWRIEMEDHPIVSYLVLKFGLEMNK